jgi:hypothetical protein
MKEQTMMLIAQSRSGAFLHGWFLGIASCLMFEGLIAAIFLLK